MQGEPPITVPPLVSKKLRSAPGHVDQDILVSILVVVRRRTASHHVFLGERLAQFQSDLLEDAVTPVTEHEVALAVRRDTIKKMDVVDDVPVAHEQIQVAVVVVVGKEGAEAYKIERGLGDATVVGNVGENTVGVTPIKGVVLEVQMDRDDVQPTIAIVIGEVGAHSRLRLPILAIPDPREKRHVLELSLPVVLKEKVPHGVVGHVNIRISVVVIIAPDDSQTLAIVGHMDARLLSDVGEGSISVVTKQDARLHVIDIGMTIGLQILG